MREPAVSVARHRAEGADAMRALGARFATAVLDATGAAATSLLVTLVGDLGAGKTTFVGGLLQALGHVGPARSPTYTLIEPYSLAGREVQHCDLYRLRDPEELEDLGLRDLRGPGSIVLVEWPEKAEGRLGAADVRIEFAYDGAEARKVRFVAGSAIGATVIDRL
ncbi:MAG TPA: tRNA (adenosine(37)-N6)-threonylcarbamoyltransferase complex ATPase subunit type 1 TsaE [Steroidobacteraceae bacterium]|nr:tRNA (adenosine(37)-N6)-threonylcarbamoyltransferase complex ATPase subunit type 1 TsaE [Steroidobacteraceae bacterium]